MATAIRGSPTHRLEVIQYNSACRLQGVVESSDRHVCSSCRSPSGVMPPSVSQPENESMRSSKCARALIAKRYTAAMLIPMLAVRCLSGLSLTEIAEGHAWLQVLRAKVTLPANNVPWEGRFLIQRKVIDGVTSIGCLNTGPEGSEIQLGRRVVHERNEVHESR